MIKVEIHGTRGIQRSDKNNVRSLFDMFICRVKLLHEYCVKPNNKNRFKNVILYRLNWAFVSFLFESDISKINRVETPRRWDGNDSPGRRSFLSHFFFVCHLAIRGSAESLWYTRSIVYCSPTTGNRMRHSRRPTVDERVLL